MIDKSLQDEDRTFQEEARRVQLFAERSQMRLYLVLAAVTFSPLLSFFLYFNSATTALHERLGELTAVIVKAAASQIDAGTHSLVVADSEAGRAGYSQLTDHLNAFRTSIPQIDRLTTLVIIDDRIFTIIDTARNLSVQGSDEIVSREPYSGENTEALMSYMAVTKNGDISSTIPFISESSDHIENCIPLPPLPASYSTLVCVDVRAAEYFAQRDRLRNNFLLASLLMLSIAVFIVYSVIQHQRQVRLSMALLGKQRDYFLKSSRTDALTGAMNRRAFQRSFAVAEAQFNRHNIAFAAIAIDIDNFKVINDSYGHDVGDQVLVVIVAELGRVLRKTDVLARMGGEEFCVLCTLNEPGQAVIVAEKLRRTIEAMKVPLKDGNFIKLTISLGVHKAQPDQTLEDVLKAADVALYVAKRGGRNRSVFYTAGMATDVKDPLGKPGSGE